MYRERGRMCDSSNRRRALNIEALKSSVGFRCGLARELLCTVMRLRWLASSEHRSTYRVKKGRDVTPYLRIQVNIKKQTLASWVYSRKVSGL